MCTCSCAHMWLVYMYAYTRMCVCPCAYTRMCVCPCAHMRMCVCPCAHTRMCSCVRAHNRTAWAIGVRFFCRRSVPLPLCHGIHVYMHVQRMSVRCTTMFGRLLRSFPSISQSGRYPCHTHRLGPTPTSPCLLYTYTTRPTPTQHDKSQVLRREDAI